MLDLLISRIKRSTFITDFVIATSTDKTDKPLVEHARKMNYPFFQGDLNNVFSRFKQVVEKYHPDCMIRITGDCPLIDPDMIDQVGKIFLQKQPELAATNNENGFPRGFDIEIFNRQFIDKLSQKNLIQEDLEHVTIYAYKNYKQFNILIIQPENREFSKYRFCVDTQEDFRAVEQVCLQLGEQCSYQDIIGLIQRNPSLLKNHLVSKQKIELNFDRIDDYHQKRRKS